LTALGEIGGILVVRCLHIGGGGDCLGLGRAATNHENTTSASAATCACQAAFTDWINSTLRGRGVRVLEDLFEELKDGRVLFHLLEVRARVYGSQARALVSPPSEVRATAPWSRGKLIQPKKQTETVTTAPKAEELGRGLPPTHAALFRC
jgi:hypothetical protein